MPAILPKLTPGDEICHGAQEWYRVSVLDLGGGHVEACIRPYKTLSELPDWWGKPGESEPDKAASRERAIRRAKTEVRKRAKVLGVNSLWTLTYRECVTDRELVARHWDLFVKRVRRVLPDFAYVATLERQKRGAWHIHLATHRLPPSLQRQGVRVKSWNLLRAIWRAVVGELGGSFNEAKGRYGSKTHKVAKYIAKYVAKAFGDDADTHKKRFWASQGIEVPRPQVMLFRREDLSALIGLVLTSVLPDGEPCTMFLDGEFFWMASEPGGITHPPTHCRE